MKKPKHWYLIIPLQPAYYIIMAVLFSSASLKFSSTSRDSIWNFTEGGVPLSLRTCGLRNVYNFNSWPIFVFLLKHLSDSAYPHSTKLQIFTTEQIPECWKENKINQVALTMNHCFISKYSNNVDLSWNQYYSWATRFLRNTSKKL